ncbi:hypothetical protein ACRAWD_20665 [Caulobacter segnis]
MFLRRAGGYVLMLLDASGTGDQLQRRGRARSELACRPRPWKTS